MSRSVRSERPPVNGCITLHSSSNQASAHPAPCYRAIDSCDENYALVFLIVLMGTKVFALDQQFRLNKPEAQTVVLMGEFNEWHGQAMTKGADGYWSLTIPLAPGTYGYKFLVDGKDWVLDPNNANRKLVDGVENSAVAVTSDPSPAATTASSPTAPHSSGGLALNGGETITLEAQLSQKRQSQATAEGYPHLLHARVAIAAPEGFDSRKPRLALVISNTEAYSNIDAMQQFKDAALGRSLVADIPAAPRIRASSRPTWRANITELSAFS
ncbi:MAG: hypothetical protein DLM52_07050 [Chthoniobacterales bacterium]|nr:MAG: hypothetical protein DLM52_07050 [Chthoniobacterales bacterium]